MITYLMDWRLLVQLFCLNGFNWSRAHRPISALIHKTVMTRIPQTIDNNGRRPWNTREIYTYMHWFLCSEMKVSIMGLCCLEWQLVCNCGIMERISFLLSIPGLSAIFLLNIYIYILFWNNFYIKHFVVPYSIDVVSTLSYEDSHTS